MLFFNFNLLHHHLWDTKTVSSILSRHWVYLWKDCDANTNKLISQNKSSLLPRVKISCFASTKPHRPYLYGGPFKTEAWQLFISDVNLGYPPQWYSLMTFRCFLWKESKQNYIKIKRIHKYLQYIHVSFKLPVQGFENSRWECWPLIDGLAASIRGFIRASFEFFFRKSLASFLSLSVIFSNVT